MVPDASIGEIGMDGRVIRDMARADIQAKKDLSPVVKELADAKETVRRQEVRIEEMSVKLADLASRLDSLGEKRGPGRPRKETEEA